MRRWVVALPLVLIGAIVATASPTSHTATAPTQSSARPVVRPAAAAVHLAADEAPTDHASRKGPGKQSPARAPTAASGFPANDLTVTPQAGTRRSFGARGVSVNLDPGSSAQRSFVVTNHSAGLRFTLQFSAVDATAGTAGDVRYSTRASASGPASWLTLSDVIATLAPGAHITVSFTIAPPSNADPGNVIAGIVVDVQHAVRTADGGAVAGTASVALPVAIQVKGAATALVSVEGVRAAKLHGQSVLEISFQNSGATANAMVGNVQVGGSEPRTISIHAAVAPLSHTVVPVPMAIPTGRKVPIAVETEDASGDQATWSGSVGFPAAAVPASSSGASSGRSSRPGAHRAPASSSVSSRLASFWSSVQSASRRVVTAIASRGRSLSPVGVGLIALVVLAGGWFGVELRGSRKRRRAVEAARKAAGPLVTVASHAVPVPATHTAVESEQLGAVATQIGSLVQAIDRLVAGIAEVVVPLAASPAPALAAPVATPTDSSESTDSSEPSAALLYMPAAAKRGVDADSGADSEDGAEADDREVDGWPTEAQLDQLAAQQRRAAPGGDS